VTISPVFDVISIPSSCNLLFLNRFSTLWRTIEYDEVVRAAETSVIFVMKAFFVNLG
jgi:hypothetical protein